ncbi:IS21 family transposase [Myxococcus sp. Y35]|uniref:IS21 family transposase n=1 Tax=Pseudomyxococcus flavus TaxID=3115648 RepID=UPI003CF395C8
MHSIREIIRQKWGLKRSHREVARSVGVSPGVVGKVMSRAAHLGLTWEAVEALEEEELERQLYGPKCAPGTERPLPDPVWIHQERKRPGVTLELLHLEYLERHPEGYRYTQFCEVYREWLARHRLTMKQAHKAGEKVFVDYSGKKPTVVDGGTGEVREAELYVAALGASSYVYAEATWSQKLTDFVGSTVRALEAFGGAPALIVPDQLKSAVTRADRYEPEVNRTFEELGRHYGLAVLPARPRKPKDKAKVERAVQLVQRWVLARLRHRVFTSLRELNEAIAEQVAVLNDRPMRLYGKSRAQLFEELDRPALKPLPPTRYAVSEWKRVKVNIDYHVDVHGHFYSAPYSLARQVLEARLTATSVELLQRGRRVAVHVRSAKVGGYTTVAEHMPKAHRAHAEWSPSRFIQWASQVGPLTQSLVEAILQDRPHPEVGYRSCLGLLRLAKRYGNARLELACGRALRAHARSSRHVRLLLEKGLEATPLPAEEPSSQPAAAHENVRGADYYH